VGSKGCRLGCRASAVALFADAAGGPTADRERSRRQLPNRQRTTKRKGRRRLSIKVLSVAIIRLKRKINSLQAHAEATARS